MFSVRLLHRHRIFNSFFIGSHSDLAKVRHFILHMYNIDPWGILPMAFTVTFCQGQGHNGRWAYLGCVRSQSPK